MLKLSDNDKQEIANLVFEHCKGLLNEQWKGFMDALDYRLIYKIDQMNKDNKEDIENYRNLKKLIKNLFKEGK